MQTPGASNVCRMCGIPGSVAVAGDNPRGLLRCCECDLMFVPARGHVDLEEERRRYTLHTNTLDHAGYVTFLGRIADAVCALGLAGPRVLDFGSGPNAVLTVLLGRRGIDCVAYDPLYALGSLTLRGCYDVVVACEVVEHLRELPGEIALLRRLVARGGYLLIHTKLRPADDGRLGTWFYTRDPTHINFFSQASLTWLARRLGMQARFSDGSDLTVLH